jgi:hypothetical protein
LFAAACHAVLMRGLRDLRLGLVNSVATGFRESSGVFFVGQLTVS